MTAPIFKTYAEVAAYARRHAQEFGATVKFARSNNEWVVLQISEQAVAITASIGERVKDNPPSPEKQDFKPDETSLLREMDTTIRVLKEQIVGLSQESEQLAKDIRHKNEMIAELNKEVQLNKEWLKNCHKALEKYEPLTTISYEEPSETDSNCHACGRPPHYCSCSR